MSVWFYTFKNTKLWDGWMVLFDGENTYWSDEMKPSGPYKKLGYSQITGGKFFYIGEL